MERTPGITRGRAVHLGPMEERGLGKGENKNNSKILAGGRGEGGFHTCTQLEDLILALPPPGLDRTPLLSTLTASSLLPSSQQGRLPRTREQTLQGLMKALRERALGTEACRKRSPAPQVFPETQGPSSALLNRPACKTTAGALVGDPQTNVWAFLPPMRRQPHGPYSALSWSNWSLQWD